MNNIKAAIYNHNNTSYLVLDHDEVSHTVYTKDSFLNDVKGFMAEYEKVKSEVLEDLENLSEDDFVGKYGDNNPGIAISEIVEKSQNLESDSDYDTVVAFEDFDTVFNNENLLAVC